LGITRMGNGTEKSLQLKGGDNSESPNGDILRKKIWGKGTLPGSQKPTAGKGVHQKGMQLEGGAWKLEKVYRGP